MASAAYVARPRASGGTESLCKQQAGSSDVGGPAGTRQQNEMPITLRGSADAPRHCQAFSFIRPRSDTYGGVQPEAVAAASLQRARAHTHTHAGVNKVPFGTISERDHQKGRDGMQRIASLPGLQGNIKI